MESAAGPCPYSIATWQQKHFADDERAEGQWLRALKDTTPDDRMIVSEGAGRGLVLVVDFSTDAELAEGGYYSWGRCTWLPTPVSFDEIRSGVFHPDRGAGLKWLRGGPKRLHDEEALRLEQLVGAFPPRALPTREPGPNDGREIWPATGGLPPEQVTEILVARTRRLWKAMGFPSAPERQRATSKADRPDLIAPGVVGEVKNRIEQDYGPAQLERYLTTLDRERPENKPWRGVLIHPERTLASAARVRIANGKYPRRITVFGVYPRGFFRRESAVRQYP